MTMKVNIANEKKKKILGGARQPDTTYISLTMKENLLLLTIATKEFQEMWLKLFSLNS